MAASFLHYVGYLFNPEMSMHREKLLRAVFHFSKTESKIE
jgi:hypothetical protein